MDQVQEFVSNNRTLVLGVLLIALLFFFYRYRQTNQRLDHLEKHPPEEVVKRINNMRQQAPHQPQPHDPSGRRLVFFYANWCGHCKNMKPEWEKLKNKYSGQYQLQEFEADENPEVMKQNQIEGFPTVKLFKEDGSVHEYQGDRTAESLEKFLTH